MIGGVRLYFEAFPVMQRGGTKTIKIRPARLSLKVWRPERPKSTTVDFLVVVARMIREVEHIAELHDELHDDVTG
ncbi:unnamed protein product [Amoebophrya sp. A25]|nr:unnamed protein product [Amoebophrya sp. A25]|eukprot:GSA25T00021609001.1